MNEKAKKARIVIDLPDGTHLEAEGPEAERLARKALDGGWSYVPYYVPYYPNPPTWYRLSVTSGTVGWTGNNLSLTQGVNAQ